MKHGKRIASIVLFGLIVLLVFSFQPAYSANQIKLKMASPWAPPHSCMMSEVVKSWEDEVTKRTNGQVVFENFWGASLGSAPEHIELVKTGVVDLVNTFQWFTPSIFPLGDFEYTFPFGPTDYKLLVQAMRQMRAEFPEMKAELDRQNVVMIMDPPWSSYELMSVGPVETIEDFKNKKICIVGRYFSRWLPPGSSAIVRPGHERYDMYRSGLLDMDILPFDLFYAFKLHEVTNYFYSVGILGVCAGPVLFNKQSFDKLSPEIQKIMFEVGKEMEIKAYEEIIPKWRKKCETAWKKRGIKVIEFPEEEKIKWANSVTDDTAAEWAAQMDAQGLPGSKMVKRWNEITTELGYKWLRKFGEKK